METEVAQAGVNLNLGSRTWMKRRFNARLLEQGPCLFPNLYPRLPGIAIAPFVKEDAALPQNFLRFTQQPPPVRDEIQKPRQHDGVRAIFFEMGGARPRRPLAAPTLRRTFAA